ncbi:hypothetical protein RHGRI_036905 [Rhododendron griersonianum]|uniref:Uncharacterized protein n=1 Tax=Rhododendron griersonianum TaxID=479676 RepID=A0AAV6HPU1_9ERIC|nr:hypothetical protein RHGRI_036905 [Rhododendron griersonianum]
MAMDSSQQGATAIPLCQDQPPSELPEDSTENLPESSPNRYCRTLFVTGENFDLREKRHIDHAATTTIVHGSSLKQPPDVYIPQMVSYEDGSQSIASSSQASHNPQTLKEMSFDPTSHSSRGGNNFMDNEAFWEMLSYSGCPQKNLK